MNCAPFGIISKLLQLCWKQHCSLTKGNKEKEWSTIVRPLKAEEREIPRNRTETPEEALYDTLISILTSPDQENVTEEVLHEAYCRDMEAFSDVFLEDFVPLTTTTTTTTTSRPTRPTTLTTEFGRDYSGRGGEKEIIKMWKYLPWVNLPQLLHYFKFTFF